MQYAFYFDQNRCSGCDTCVVACKDWNGVKPGPVRWRKRTEPVEEGTFPNVRSVFFVFSCNHCNSPACAEACAYDAIGKDPDTGIVYVDKNKCQASGECVKKCPYGAIGLADDRQETPYAAGGIVPHAAQKCTLCRDRLAINKRPACVAACPQRALDMGTTDYIRMKYPLAVRALDVKYFPTDTVAQDGTKLSRPTSPNLFVNPKYR